MNVFTYGARQYGAYPYDVYNKVVLRFCTFIIPYALIQYYPLQYLLGRTTNIAYALLPVAAAWFLIPCLALWKYGVSKYKSTGS
jgi:ABC-2 type transport system permease protein